RLSRLHHGAVVGPEFFGDFGALMIEIRLPDYRRGIASPDVFGDGAVGQEEARVRVLDEEIVGNLVDEGHEQGALLAPAHVGPMAPGCPFPATALLDHSPHRRS